MSICNLSEPTGISTKTHSITNNIIYVTRPNESDQMSVSCLGVQAPFSNEIANFNSCTVKGVLPEHMIVRTKSKRYIILGCFFQNFHF